MKKTIYTLAAATMLLMGSSKLQAQCSMGNLGQQVSTHTNLDGGVGWGQSFIPTCSGALNAITLNMVSGTANAFAGNITIYAGSGNGGAVVYSQAVSAPNFSGNSVINLTTPPTVVAGNTYTFIINNNDVSGSTVDISGTDGVSFGSDSYTDGAMYLVFSGGSAIVVSANWDLLFQVNIAPPPCTPTTSTTNATICPGGSYSLGGTSYNAAGTYVAHLINAGGCDSAATLNLSVLAGSGYNGKALSFDGNDDYVAMPNSIVSSLNSMTIESWVLINDNNYWQRVFDFGSSPLVNMFFTTRSDDEVPRFAITTAGGFNEERITAYGLGGQLQTGVWHHIAVTLNAATTTGTLYIDGVQVGQNTSMTLTPSILGATTQNYLGKSQYPADPYFNGSIDEVRIWNTAKTLAQIKASMGELTGNESGLVAYYNFNAVSGTTLANKKTSALNGTLNNFSLTGTTSNWSTYNAVNITGASAVCVGSSITLGNDAGLAGGVWSSYPNSATVSTTGVVSGKNSGSPATITYRYSLGGCNLVSTKILAVNAIPATPSIGYKAPFSNPQRGAPTGGFCVGKVFGVLGTPTGGVWSTTGCITTTNTGVSTINTTGAGSLTYTFTNTNGCANSRTMTGAGYTCAARGAISNEQVVNNNMFIMYPNPARPSVSLKVETLIGEGQIIITDLYGKTVKSQPLSMGNNTVDVANLTKGMYFISTITSEGKTTKKSIVE